MTELKPVPHADKKSLEVPKTEMSISQDKSFRSYVMVMIAVMAVLVIAGGGAIYWLFGVYIHQSNTNRGQDITLGLLEQKAKDIDALKPNYASINKKDASGKSEADMILYALPTEDAFGALAAMVERMSREAGVEVSTITKSTKVATVTVASGPQKYDITISAKGTPEQIQVFMEKTENSARVMDFVSITIPKPKDNESTTASISFTVYYQPKANISSTEQDLK